MHEWVGGWRGGTSTEEQNTHFHWRASLQSDATNASCLHFTAHQSQVTSFKAIRCTVTTPLVPKLPEPCLSVRVLLLAATNSRRHLPVKSNTPQATQTPRNELPETRCSYSVRFPGEQDLQENRPRIRGPRSRRNGKCPAATRTDV